MPEFSVYIETSIFSYLAARPSGNMVTAGRQHLSWQWWDHQRSKYDLLVSEAVVEEARRGDPGTASRRLELIAGLERVQLSSPVRDLATKLVYGGPLPPKAEVDALHIALATMAGSDFLLTWNFKHLANAVMRRQVEALIRSNGHEPPIICTPEELLAEE